jgi:hypothetical protein
VFALDRFNPIVLAVPPLYVPEKVRVLFVAVRSARLLPRVIPLMVLEVRPSTPPLFDSPVPRSDTKEEPPRLKFVVEAVVNDPYVVEEFPNVCRAVKVLAVYVFGIVVEAWMKELIALFCVVESIVNAPATLDNPVPSKLLNDEPLTIRLVVEALRNDE